VIFLFVVQRLASQSAITGMKGRSVACWDLKYFIYERKKCLLLSA